MFKFRSTVLILQLFCRPVILSRRYEEYAFFRLEVATRGVLWKDIWKGLRTATLLKKRLWHRCFHVNFVKLLRTPSVTKYLQWLLPKMLSFCWSIIYFVFLKEVVFWNQNFKQLFIHRFVLAPGITLSIYLKSISYTTQPVETSGLLHFTTNRWCLMDMFYVKSLKFSDKSNR